jgi:hypothetical protein
MAMNAKMQGRAGSVSVPQTKLPSGIKLEASTEIPEEGSLEQPAQSADAVELSADCGGCEQGSSSEEQQLETTDTVATSSSV